LGFQLGEVEEGDLVEKEGVVECGDDNGSILEETKSMTTRFDEGGAGVVANRSLESCVVRILNSEASPKTMGNGFEFGRVKDLIGNGWIAAKDLIGKLSATWKERARLWEGTQREKE